jgi:hypothetical protein
MDNNVGWVVESFRGQILFKLHNIQDISFLFVKISNDVMENGGVDTADVNSRQHKMGQKADFPPLKASSIFDF